MQVLSSAGLAGCAPTAATTTTIDDTTSNAGATYADGTYTADGSYQAPSGVETITVELTVTDGTVTAVDVSQDSSDPQAQQYQSLTSRGFDPALDDIRSQAS